ncbi:MAG TPA: DUF1501 domain-containing protein [Tepidisphaeraceae bacterium]|jgi:hypothetical protein|nr:DUF1501 domain-containing protein [Tepidisphaeraceae bacterium]
MAANDNSWCGSKQHVRPGASRREFLYVGLIGGLGLSLGDYLSSRAMGSEVAMPGTTVGLKEGVAKSVIHIFMPGGMASHESFDPKPDAPIEYRGPFSTTRTKLDGEYFSENLPQIGQIADKITVIRSMTHGEAAHERGTHNMFTGYRPSPALDFPSFGSVVSEEFGPRKNMPPYVCIPSMPTPYAGSGYLSTKYGPFSLGADPSDGGFKVRDLQLNGDVNDARFARQQSMLATVDNHFRTLEKSDSLAAMDSFYQRAYSLISSKEARESFNLAAEPEAVKEQYGKNTAGMRMLMARRLVEGGVRFISMTYGGWDHHSNINQGFKGQMPAFDKAFAALIRDLDSRKLLDSTLVMVSSEFGRTPKVNQTEGRDHWPKCFSVVMAGGGIKQGLIYGSSDPTGGEPANDPVCVEDLSATLYHQLGIDPDKRLVAPGNRPIDIVRGGKVITDILA